MFTRYAREGESLIYSQGRFNSETTQDDVEVLSGTLLKISGRGPTFTFVWKRDQRPGELGLNESFLDNGSCLIVISVSQNPG